MTRATKAPLSMRPAKPWAVPVVAAALLAAASEGAADSLRVGRPSARGFAGVPRVTGIKHGFFRNQGLELEYLPREPDMKTLYTEAFLPTP